MMAYGNLDMAADDMATNKDEADRVRSLLRAIQYPGFQRNIVAAGFVKEIEVDGTRVTVHFAPNTRDQTKVDQMEADIRDALAGAGSFAHVEIKWQEPFAGSGVLSSGRARERR